MQPRSFAGRPVLTLTDSNHGRMNTQRLTILTGHSRGMGLAMAEQLLAPGHTLLCISRHASKELAAKAKAGMDHFTRCLALEQALLANGARICSLAPGVIDTDMQLQLRSGDDAFFPDRAGFAGLHANGQLSSPADAAQRVLAFLARADFGENPVADVRG